MNYYCLVAGLPDLHMDDTKGYLSLEEMYAELEGQLSPSDADLVDLLYAEYDNENFLKFLADKDAELNPLGRLTREDWDDLVNLMQEVDVPEDPRLCPYFIEFYSVLQADENELKGFSKEDFLTGLYYEYAMRQNNDFIQAWFEFNLNVNNLLTAITCRKHDIDQQKLVVGHNEIAKILRHSHSRDYGIGGLFAYTDDVIKIAEESNLLNREKNLDSLKWSWLEEHTFFDYFSIEKVLAHIIKVATLERWKILSVEEGTQIFKDMLQTMKKRVVIDAV